MEITIMVRTVDGYRDSRRFKTLAGAQRFAHRHVGEHPEIGRSYAVAGDGISRVAVRGSTLAEIFPEA